jgi:hypothetical protein
LAWLLAQKPWIVPIPGTRKIERLEENIGAASVQLTSGDLNDIENAASTITIKGARYAEAQERMIDRSKAGVPVEMHLYAQGGHAFGLRPTEYPATKWPLLVEAWLRQIGMISE